VDAEHQLYILGPRRLQNDLLAQFAETDTDLELACLCCESQEEIPLLVDIQARHTSMILLDCQDSGLDNTLRILEGLEEPYFRHYLVVLFNVKPSAGIEELALQIGVKGFFYSDDPLERIGKGIQMIFGGELWVSREILSKSYAKSRKGERPLLKKDNPLTDRETEILALISAGAKNDQIAEELCISPNTVKTHIYNIFKKISVPNRLQAALWAVKNF